MKHFIKNFSLFGIVLLFVIYPLDRLFSISLSNTESGEFSVWNDIFKGKVDSELLIYGSSRAWVQVNPEILKDSLGLSVYNFGVDGHNFRLQYLRHIINADKAKKPRFIVHIVDHATLQKRPDLYNLNQFLPYMLFNKTIMEYTLDYEGFELPDYYIPLIRYSANTNAMANILFSWLGIASDNRLRVNGFKANDKKWTSDFKKAKKKIKSYKIDLDSGTIDLYQRFLNECKSDSIKVIMVYPPEYIEGQAFMEGRDNLLALYQEWADLNEIPFIDYSNDTLSFQKDKFYNVLHLNTTGSQLFSADLSKRLKGHIY